MGDGCAWALRYASLGWRVLPLRTKDKRPLLKDWARQAIADERIIRRWWQQWPNAGVGIATGKASGVFVLDVDGGKDGFETLAALEDEHGPLPDTPTVRTGGGGEHRYFRLPQGVTVRNSAGRLGPGLDIRGEGGFVVAPPSKHPSGKAYEWRLDPWETPLADPPDWLVRLLAEPERPRRRNDDATDKVREGRRNDYLTSVAGRLRRSGLGEAAITGALLAENKEKCDPPLPDAEVRQIAKSVCRYLPGFSLSDSGNAERFAAAHKGKVFYSFDLGRWGVWNGKIWRLGDEVGLRHLADETVRLIHLEAANTTEPEQRRAIARWALQSESRFRIANMLEQAKHLVAIEAKDLDTHPDLLTCENGIIDLCTGNLQPHDPALRITKMIRGEYDPEAECPAWRAFLDLITAGDAELAHFLKVAVGYSLTGRVDEQCFFLLYGQGMNGKTTFVEALRHLMGDYSAKVNAEALLLHRNGNGATPDIANLRGVRFAVASELPQGRTLNESLAKDLTGGDTLTARHLYGNPFTFQPTHKLWAFGNHKPSIRGDDLGIWRRVKMIPFRAIIPPEQRRPISEVLATFERERSGILRWAVEGATEWYAKGLPRCRAVDAATEEYRTESDWVSQFLAECCESGSEYREAKGDLYAAFRQWVADQYGDKAPGQRWLTTRLLARGFTQGGDGRRDIIGVRLRTG